MSMEQILNNRDRADGIGNTLMSQPDVSAAAANKSDTMLAEAATPSPFLNQPVSRSARTPQASTSALSIAQSMSFPPRQIGDEPTNARSHRHRGRALSPAHDAHGILGASWRDGKAGASALYGNHSILGLISLLGQQSSLSTQGQKDDVRIASPKTHSPKQTVSPIISPQSVHATRREQTTGHHDVTDRQQAQPDGADRHDMHLASSLLTVKGLARETTDAQIAAASSPDSASSISQSGTAHVAPPKSLTPAERKAQLEVKLKDIFGLPTVEEIVGEYRCWYFRSALLPGFLYLTAKYLCFYAYMPRNDGQVIRSAYFSKRNSRLRIYQRFWFVLKDDTLSWYGSSTDPYFPVNQIDMHYVTGVELSASNAMRFHVHTASKRTSFSCASHTAAQEWVKAIKKCVFRAQHDGDSVRIAIPLQRVAEVAQADEFTLMERLLRVSVHDGEDTGINAVSDYYFSFAESLDPALTDISRWALAAQQNIKDNPALTSTTIEATHLGTATSQSTRRSSAAAADSSPEDATVYPPGYTGLRDAGNISSTHLEAGYGRNWGISQWLRAPSRRLMGLQQSLSVPSYIRSISEVVMKGRSGVATSPAQVASASANTLLPPDMLSDTAFREIFGLSERDGPVELRRHCYLYRGLPVFGQLYITTKSVCFRSLSLVWNTKMILPIGDVTAIEKSRAYRFGYSGLLIQIRGHQELFMEISSPEKRDAIITLLDKRMNDMANTASDLPTHEAAEIFSSLQNFADASSSLDTASPASPMFSSTTSSFVTFKSPGSMRITCLTVGSRGDVQPYIALCIGLQKEGHKCRIASHPEYRAWVESYGIEFREVGGDPAELMRLCIENGTFTVNFMREGMSKFRGWLDGLLSSAWEACQGSDLLIESPSTMAGYHIAEALQIPFFRAFTMPWTRTRTYPHAFAVPDTKMGGAYNYMTYTIFDQVFWRAIAPQMNRWRKKELGLRATTLDELSLHQAPFMYNFSPAVVPRAIDWNDHIHVCGYWNIDTAAGSAASEWQPPPSLADFLRSAKELGKKLVYIGFGSIVVSDPDGLTQAIVEAVTEAGVHAIVSKGWSDRAIAQEDRLDIALPPSIYAVDSVPHDWLFPQMDAVCHHGGSGTTGASLRAGKPTLIRPFFGDQYFWANRVQALGVGVALQQLSAEILAEALQRVTTDQAMINNAASIGKSIQAENGVAKAIETIYRELDYAISLIPRKATRVSQEQSSPGPAQVHFSDAAPGADARDSDESSTWDMLSDDARSAAIDSDSEADDREAKHASDGRHTPRPTAGH